LERRRPQVRIGSDQARPSDDASPASDSIASASSPEKRVGRALINPALY
jgi:hypothetical protein